MALFEAKNLSKRFGDRVVLEDISLKFEKGELSGIMGPNGAGKSTCFNVLTGHFPPDRGEVILEGEDITGMSPLQIAKKGIARSFQIISLFDEFTALENVLFALPEVRSAGFNIVRDVASDRATISKALSVIEQVGLGPSADVQSSSLPYGERRSLEIAVALAAEPRVLFLDEPTQGMGAEGRNRLLELITKLKRKFTIVMIEHDMDFLFSLADRVSVIHWGQVIAHGTPDELRSNPWVQKSNLGAKTHA
ncbi:MAG TPA: ABC transporter ATP-binding protein [Polyangiaceae bacterium]|nr:ABC transporter ATP-binding protein [Polyangiaceae bacterium]